jgi:hypothetical protein
MTQSWFFDKINKIDQQLAKLSKRERKKTQNFKKMKRKTLQQI